MSRRWSQSTYDLHGPLPSVAALRERLEELRSQVPTGYQVGETKAAQERLGEAERNLALFEAAPTDRLIGDAARASIQLLTWKIQDARVERRMVALYRKGAA